MTSAAFSPIHTVPQVEPANFLNLLIVDDERSIREACREIAQSLGFNASVAESAEQAFRLLESQTFDAALLDLRLPGAGGLEALRRIKERRPEAAVIVRSNARRSISVSCVICPDLPDDCRPYRARLSEAAFEPSCRG